MSTYLHRTLSRRSVLQATGALALSGMIHPVPAVASHVTPRGGPSGTAAFLELMQHVDKRMKQVGVPSVGVAVVNGDTRHTCALGITSIDNPQLADAETMYRVGPLSTLFTSSAIGALLDSGSIALEASVRSYLPTFAVEDSVTSERVTVRDLVTHRTGWQGELPNDPGAGDEAIAQYVEAMTTLTSVSPPGQYFSIGRTNSILAGHLVAEVTGLPFETAMRELTFSPLSMEHSSFDAATMKTWVHVAGHTRRNNDVMTVNPLSSSRAAAPATGLFSNLNEILHFAAFHASATTPPMFLPPSVRAELHRPLEPAGSVGPMRVDAMAVDWMIAEFGGTRISMRAGSDHGQSAMMAVVPSARFAVVVLTNADFAQDLAIETAFMALDLFTGLRPPAPTPSRRPRAELEKLAGTYSVPDGPQLIVELDGSGLNLQITGPAESSGTLAFVSPLTAMFTDSGSTTFVDFVLDRDGDISWLRYMGQLAKRDRA